MDNAMHKDNGFTIIELMAIVAIISILSVLALSVYSSYVVRSKVSEGLAFAAEAKTSVSEYYYTNRVMPQNNSQAGLPAADTYDGYEFIRRLELSSDPIEGTVVITFKIPGTRADNKMLQLVPATTANDEITWTCIPPAVDGMGPNEVPPNCRG